MPLWTEVLVEAVEWEESEGGNVSGLVCEEVVLKGVGIDVPGDWDVHAE
jgi:hypothetical protein